MALKEYYKVDLVTGYPLEVLLLDDELTDGEGNVISVPVDMKQGWGGDRGLFNPIYNFEIDDWVEGKPIEEVEYERIKISDLNLMQQELSYLRETDWYSIRSLESGKNIPFDVISKRSTARDVISNIRVKYNLGGN